MNGCRWDLDAGVDAASSEGGGWTDGRAPRRTVSMEPSSDASMGEVVGSTFS